MDINISLHNLHLEAHGLFWQVVVTWKSLSEVVARFKPQHCPYLSLLQLCCIEVDPAPDSDILKSFDMQRNLFLCTCDK